MVQQCMLSCNSFPNCGWSLPRMQTGFVHSYYITRARILGNDCLRFEKLLQDCVWSLPRMQTGFVHSYYITRARILGNDCLRFEKLLQDCVIFCMLCHVCVDACQCTLHADWCM